MLGVRLTTPPRKKTLRSRNLKLGVKYRPGIYRQWEEEEEEEEEEEKKKKKKTELP
jgi:hypothetical protein